jgi:hypothetical protein
LIYTGSAACYDDGDFPVVLPPLPRHPTAVQVVEVKIVKPVARLLTQGC